MAESGIKLTGFKDLLQELTFLQKTQLARVIQDSLNKDLAPALKKNEEGVIRKTFRDPVAFTRNAPMTTEFANFNNLEINFKLRDQADGGNSPDRYLQPQTVGGPVYVTRFTRRLRYENRIDSGEYAMHWGFGIGPGATSTNGRVTGGFVNSVLAGLGKGERSAAAVGPLRKGTDYAKAINSYESSPYFILGSKLQRKPQDTGNNRNRSRSRESGFDGPGIYTRKGGDLRRVFRILSGVPTVAKRYDWSAARIGSAAEPIFRAAVERRLQAAMDLRPDFATPG
jgi:hypothetical protein